MKGILILAHGSRKSSTEHTLEGIVESMRVMLNDKGMNCEVEFSFIEFSEKTIEAGLDSFVDRGIKDVLVIPYFLFEGVHTREGIPRRIEEYLERNKDKNIQIKLGKSLGLDSRLAAILVDRVQEELV